MKMWLDTEFDGFGGKLISIALAAEDGEVFYAVLADTASDPWVQQNVIPHLRGSVMTREAAQSRLERFLTRSGREIEVIADWPDDIRYFCELLITGPGTRIPIPDVTKMRIDLQLSSELSKVPHNAMCDAIAIRAMDMSMNPTPAPKKGE